MSNQTRLAALRDLMQTCELDAWLVPRSDEHQGEYVAPYAERLRWSTGFDGSAGMAIIMSQKAAIFVDGRYTLQARKQVDLDLFEVVHTADISVGQWMAKHTSGMMVGFDPWLHTESEIDRYKQACAGLGVQFVAMEGNLIDDVWHDQPEMPLDPILIYEDLFAGESRAAKCMRLGMELMARKIDAAVITSLDSIAWLLNIRGRDIPCTPVALAYAILYANGKVDLFTHPDKLKEKLGSDVRLYPYKNFMEAPVDLKNRRVLYDPKTSPIQVRVNLDTVGAQVVTGDDICLMAKACKNSVELEGMRKSHVRDGAALTEFLSWATDRLQKGALSELQASDALRGFREKKDHFQGLSFETIAGSGPNGAIIHYRVTPESDRLLRTDELFLLDSGAQYLDGTTDVTRTVAFSKPTPEQKDRFTRVLKGHIAIATAVFPIGTTGGQLDVLARKSLWSVGLDYQHGTGHGVGSYLCVHEGPQRIAKGLVTDVALRPGMILSNEPGYYKEGEYGIRIESLIIVRPHSEGFLRFETITMAPICLDLVDVDLLTDEEKEWLNAYHREVWEKLMPMLDPSHSPHVQTWLEKQTVAV
ncbi:MAG: aminopeptidase P family protein [Alphaproteobacteria bacterium]|nr:aminopeptidase P family protein [Alphaproteobacteria bacterium]